MQRLQTAIDWPRRPELSLAGVPPRDLSEFEDESMLQRTFLFAGHSKWANIKHRKGKVDAQRTATFTKVGSCNGREYLGNLALLPRCP